MINNNNCRRKLPCKSSTTLRCLLVITAFDSDNKAFVFTTVETTAVSFNRSLSQFSRWWQYNARILIRLVFEGSRDLRSHSSTQNVATQCRRLGGGRPAGMSGGASTRSARRREQVPDGRYSVAVASSSSPAARRGACPSVRLPGRPSTRREIRYGASRPT